MGAAEITRFLRALAIQRNVAASTQNQALSALLFLCRDVLQQELPWLDDSVRAKTRERIPVVLTREEVHAVIDGLDGPTRLLGLLLYSAGLRLLEALLQRVRNVDFTSPPSRSCSATATWPPPWSTPTSSTAAPPASSAPPTASTSP
jgi:integrase